MRISRPVDLFTVSVLNAEAPVMDASAAPVNEIVLEPAVNVPLLMKLPLIVCVNVPAEYVTPEPIVRSPFTAEAPAAVFVPPFENVKL